MNLVKNGSQAAVPTKNEKKKSEAKINLFSRKKSKRIFNNKIVANNYNNNNNSYYYIRFL